ncbi:hypothetical protein D3C81_1469190 [compost metagenome]
MRPRLQHFPAVKNQSDTTALASFRRNLPIELVIDTSNPTAKNRRCNDAQTAILRQRKVELIGDRGWGLHRHNILLPTEQKKLRPPFHFIAVDQQRGLFPRACFSGCSFYYDVHEDVSFSVMDLKTVP